MILHSEKTMIDFDKDSRMDRLSMDYFSHILARVFFLVLICRLKMHDLGIKSLEQYIQVFWKAK